MSAKTKRMRNKWRKRVKNHNRIKVRQSAAISNKVAVARSADSNGTTNSGVFDLSAFNNEEK